jgi:hypothetical protein
MDERLLSIQFHFSEIFSFYESSADDIDTIK